MADFSILGHLAKKSRKRSKIRPSQLSFMINIFVALYTICISWSSQSQWIFGFGSHDPEIRSKVKSYISSKDFIYGSMLSELCILIPLLIWALVGRLLRIYHPSIPPEAIFDFRSCEMGLKIKILNCYTSIIIELLDFKLHWTILDWRLHDCAIKRNAFHIIWCVFFWNIKAYLIWKWNFTRG